MRALAGLAASGTFLPFVTEASAEPTTLAALAPKSPLSPEDDQFLEEIEHLNFCYFWEQVDPDTGMVKDRSNIRTVDNGIVARIAATVFGLTEILLGQNRGYTSMPVRGRGV